MPTPTTLQPPTVFWTGAGAVRRHPAYGGSRPIRTDDHRVATCCLTFWLWNLMEPGKGIEPFSAGSKPALLTAAPARYLVCKVRLELTRPCGHQVLNLARLPFRHMHILVGRVGFEPTVFLMSRLYRPLASANLHTYPYWLQGRDSDPHITVYEAVVLPVDYPAILCPKVGAGVEERV